MNNRTTIFLLAIAMVLSIGCTVNSNPKNLEKGFYQLKRTSNEINSNDMLASGVKFTSATIHVINSDSLEFIGEDNIAHALWGHDKFGYKIEGENMLLKDGDYINKIKFSFTTDSLLELKVNTKGLKSLYFDHLVLKLNGKYKVAGFQTKENATMEQAQKYIDTAFKGECLNFTGKDSVVMSKPFAAFIGNDSIITDSVFNYRIAENKILFNNQKNKFEVTYQYDGVVRLFVDNNVIKRLDLVD